MLDFLEKVCYNGIISPEMYVQAAYDVLLVEFIKEVIV